MNTFLWVFYYQWEGTTQLVCVSGDGPGRKSKIWEGNNTCAWIVPGCIPMWVLDGSDSDGNETSNQ